jgi:zinc protease
MIEPEQAVLSNGIPVILQNYEGTVAATYWWVRTGSADETPPEAGFAHFLEHMLFKDAAAKETGRASTGQMAQAIESLGGDINAYTSFDQTVYHVTCAATHWERVIDAFGAMAAPQRFLKADFEREREVILEELRKNEDSPGRQLFQSLFTETFKKHPYGRPVIGYVKTLKAAKVATLEAFYRRAYVPERMGLVLVGPIGEGKKSRRAEIMKLLEKRFGARAIPRRKSAKFPFTRLPEPGLRSGGGALARPFDVKTPSLSIAFRVPELSHADTPALDLLAGILGMGELSRLHQRLFRGNALVTDVSGGLYVPMDPGMIFFQAEAESLEKLEAAGRGLLEELARIRDEGVTDAELSRVIVNAESERLYATQSADGMAGRVGFLKFVVGDMDFDGKYLSRLKETDSARIREVARRYFDVRRMNAVYMIPKETKAFEAKTILAEAARLLPGEPAPAAVKKKAAEGVVRLRLPSGIRVSCFERPQSHVFSMHASVLGGVRLEEVWGESHLMSSTWTKGAAGKDADAIAALVEGSAASVDGVSGRNSSGLQMTGLARDWGKLSDVFADILLEPAFPESEVDHSRRVAEDSIRSIEDHSAQLCSKLFLETLFEAHPYGRTVVGSLETVKQVRSAQLLGTHRLWVRPERLAIAISGAVKRSVLEKWLAELDRRAQALASRSPAPPAREKLADEPELKAPRWVERTLKREQEHILVGGLGTTLDAEDRHALRLMQTLLGGQSGRLFIELREKKSLAYTVSPMSFEGLERGYAATYIACAPDKRAEALAGIRAVLEKLANDGPTEKEMARAKEFFLGRRAMDLQSDSSLASHFGLELLYGLPETSEAELAKKIRAIRPKEIQAVCRKYLVDPNQVTSVVG